MKREQAFQPTNPPQALVCCIFPVAMSMNQGHHKMVVGCHLKGKDGSNDFTDSCSWFYNQDGVKVADMNIFGGILMDNKAWLLHECVQPGRIVNEQTIMMKGIGKT